MNTYIPHVTKHHKTLANAVRIINIELAKGAATFETVPAPDIMDARAVGNMGQVIKRNMVVEGETAADIPDIRNNISDINALFSQLDAILPVAT